MEKEDSKDLVITSSGDVFPAISGIPDAAWTANNWRTPVSMKSLPWTLTIDSHPPLLRTDLLAMSTEGLQELIDKIVEDGSAGMCGEGIYMETFIQNILLQRRVDKLEEMIEELKTK
jgi:hypothetical protein